MPIELSGISRVFGDATPFITVASLMVSIFSSSSPSPSSTHKHTLVVFSDDPYLALSHLFESPLSRAFYTVSTARSGRQRPRAAVIERAAEARARRGGDAEAREGLDLSGAEGGRDGLLSEQQHRLAPAAARWRREDRRLPGTKHRRTPVPSGLL